MSTDAQTQSMSRVPAAGMPRISAASIAAPDAEMDASTRDTQPTDPGPGDEIAASHSAADSAAPSHRAEVARNEPVQHAYEMAVARLNALHDSWGAAMAEFRDDQADSEPAKTAA